MNRAAMVCAEAAKIVQGERPASYDRPERNFGRIAAYWNDWLEQRDLTARPITEHDVAIMMALLKVAREQFRHSHDNCVDAVGYLACAAEVVHKAGLEGYEDEDQAVK